MYFIWGLDFDFPTKLENPGEEGGAEGDLGGEEEVGVVYKLCFGLFAKVVDDGVHGVLMAQKFHRRALAIEELEGFFAEIRNAVAFGLPHGGVVEKLGRLGNPVNPEGGDLLMLVGPAYHVVAVAVPGQRVGTENIGLSVVLDALPLGCGVGEIEELDLLLFVYGPVDYFDELVDMLVLRLDPFRQGDVSFQVACLVDVSQGRQLVRQGFALGGGDELGGGHGVDQQLELGLLEGPGTKVIFVLRGVDRPHVVAGHSQGFHVPSDGDAEGIDAPALLQQPYTFRRGDGMLGVAVGLQKLQQPQQANSALILFLFHRCLLNAERAAKASVVRLVFMALRFYIIPYFIL